MPRRAPFLAASALALAVVGAAGVLAQVEGGSRGVAPVDSGGSYEVSDIHVDVSARTADEARLGGWRLAQRKAYAQLAARLGVGGGTVSDGTLDGMVSGIVIGHEQIGPTRYIATLGVLFDRARAGGVLGISAYAERSPPLLVMPVLWSGGVGQVFEGRSDWQAAWARFRTGNSAIDYVRPSGTGPDSLLLNVGQTGRPGRGWWRTILDEYGASGILIPTARLYRQWPGGPVIGVFQARYGADNQLLGSITLRVGSEEGLPRLLDAGVARLDDLYQRALRLGYLNPDPTLSPPPAPKPTPTDLPDADLAQIVSGLDTPSAPGSATGGQGAAVSVQFDTPGAGAVAATEAAVRGIPGVRQAQTTSLALGGQSVMRVLFDGDPELLRTSLQSRGFQVFGSGQSLRIRRAPQLLPPDVSAGPGGG
jgi:hypothetical protein